MREGEEEEMESSHCRRPGEGSTNRKRSGSRLSRSFRAFFSCSEFHNGSLEGKRSNQLFVASNWS